ncbi:MAG TPA: (d)CMP kinase [Mycobacteriales bacterium]|jgi:cytidylate kinase|nr:(d)CMP kinase [Mycobacteriales bacterium]
MSPVWSEQAPEAGRDVIALDGPSGTGKSTVARGLARRLGFRYLDTGAMYRAVTWAVLREGVDPDDAAAVTDLAARTAITISTDPNHQHVTVDGHPVDREIRSKAVTTAVSPVSAAPGVRALLVAAQRELIGPGAVVVEGRDIGTVVAPDAPLKIFLTASQDVRATRRSRQDGSDDRATAADLDRRDTYDSSRAHSPLRAADDAVHVDTTTMGVDEVIQRLIDLAGERAITYASPGK